MKTMILRMVLVATVAVALLATSHVQAQDGDLSKRLLENGVKLLADNRYSDGIRALESVVTQYPNTSVAADALLELARHHFDTAADTDPAQKAAALLISTYRDFNAAPMGYVMAGRILLSQTREPAQMQTALSDFETVGRVYPGSEAVPMAGFYAGETLRLTGRPKDAIDRYRVVVSQYPRSPWASRALLGTGLCHVALDQDLEAMSALQLLRSRFSGTADAATALAWNTQLYRLHVRPSSQQSSYQFAGRTIPSGTAKLEDVETVVIDESDNVLTVGGDRLLKFSQEGTLSPLATIASPKGAFIAFGRVVIIQKGALKGLDGPVLPLRVQKPDGTPKILEDVTGAVSWSTGEYLVVDSAGIRKFARDGAPLGVLTSARTDKVAVNRLDEIAALNTDAKVVTVLSRDGKAVRSIATKAAGYEMRNPVDVGYDALGHLFVLDRGRASVLAFSPSGRLLSTFSIDAKAPGAFHKGVAMSFDSAGRLYIYDDGLKRIQVYQ